MERVLAQGRISEAAPWGALSCTGMLACCIRGDWLKEMERIVQTVLNTTAAGECRCLAQNPRMPMRRQERGTWQMMTTIEKQE